MHSNTEFLNDFSQLKKKITMLENRNTNKKLGSKLFCKKRILFNNTIMLLICSFPVIVENYSRPYIIQSSSTSRNFYSDMIWNKQHNKIINEIHKFKKASVDSTNAVFKYFCFYYLKLNVQFYVRF